MQLTGKLYLQVKKNKYFLRAKNNCGCTSPANARLTVCVLADLSACDDDH